MARACSSRVRSTVRQVTEARKVVEVKACSLFRQRPLSLKATRAESGGFWGFPLIKSSYARAKGAVPTHLRARTSQGLRARQTQRAHLSTQPTAQRIGHLATKSESVRFLRLALHGRRASLAKGLEGTSCSLSLQHIHNTTHAKEKLAGQVEFASLLTERRASLSFVSEAFGRRWRERFLRTWQKN